MRSSTSVWESDAGQKLVPALQPHADGRTLAIAAEAMRQLGEAALRDRAARDTYLQLMYDVYRHPDHRTFAARRWLARQLASVEESFVQPSSEPGEALPA